MQNNRLTLRRPAGGSDRASWCVVSASLIFSTLPVAGQSLRLSPAAGSPGSEVSIHVFLTSPRDREAPSALQWDITIPVSQLMLLDENLPPGPAAKAAGKSISCRERSKTASAQKSTCILYGGREPIQAGVVAVLRLKIADEAPEGAAQIRLDQAIAVSKDATRIEMKPVETTIRIRKK